MSLTFGPPLDDGGSRVTSYRIDYDVAPPVGEVQTITTSLNTGPNEVQSVTTRIARVAEVQLVRIVAAAAPSVQAVTTSASMGETLGGGFSLSVDMRPYGGPVLTTGLIASDAPAMRAVGNNGSGPLRRSIAEALEAVPGVGAVDASRVGPDAQGGYSWALTFTGLRGRNPGLALGQSGLTGAGAGVAVDLDLPGVLLDGTFALSFRGVATTALAWDASAAEMRIALQAMENVDLVSVARWELLDGFIWSVSFVGDAVAGDQPPLSASYDVGLVGVEARVVVCSAANTSTSTSTLNGTFALGDCNIAAAMNASMPSRGPQDGRCARPYFTSGARAEYDGDHHNDADASWWSTLEGRGDDEAPRSATGGSGELLAAPQQWAPRLWGGRDARAREGLWHDDVASAIDSGVLRGDDRTEQADGDVLQSSAPPLPVDGSTLGGSLTLCASAGGSWSRPIAFDADAATIQSALASVGSVGAVDVAVERGAGPTALGTAIWTIYWTSLGGERPLLLVNTSGLKGEGATASVAVLRRGTEREVQTITLVPATVGGMVNGTLRLNFGGVDAQPVFMSGVGCDTVNATAIASALAAVSSVGQGVVVSCAPTARNGGPQFNITFARAGGPLPLLTVNVSALMPSVLSVGGVVVARLVAGTSSMIGGSFTITAPGNARTPPLPWNASAFAVATALDASGEYGCPFAVTRTSIGTPDGGYTWRVAPGGGAAVAGTQALLVVDGAALTGTAPLASVSVAVVGVPPPFNSGPAGAPVGSTIFVDVGDADDGGATSYASATQSARRQLAFGQALPPTPVAPFAVQLFGGINQGVPYYARITAVNSIGYSPARIVGAVVPMPQVPPPPTHVMLEAASPSSVRVSFNQPLLLPSVIDTPRESAVDAYRIEWDTDELRQSTQLVVLATTASAKLSPQYTQTITTSLPPSPAVQLIGTVGTAGGALPTLETQAVSCDAVGGSFRLSFRGSTTWPVLWNASVDAAGAAALGAPGTSLQEALEQLPTIDSVLVSLVASGVSPSQRDASGTVDVACRGYDPISRTVPKLILVTFVSVPGLSGALPALVAHADGLVGDKALSVTRDGSDGVSVPGVANVSGSFRLAFRGYETGPIGAGASAATVTAALSALPSLGTVTVAGPVPSVDYAGAGASFWVITFTDAALVGDIPSLDVVADCECGSDGTLMGNGARARVCAGGATCEGVVTRAGAAIAGTFALTLLGHMTPPLPHDIGADQLAAAISTTLPDVTGPVSALRSGPDPQGGYSWTLAFAIPLAGAIPAGCGALPLMQVDVSLLVGTGGPVALVTGAVSSAACLGGAFSLRFGNVMTAALPPSATADEVAVALLALPTVGGVRVSVAPNASRTSGGIAWIVTFVGCSPLLGVCSDGDQRLLTIDTTNLTGYAPALTGVSELTRGSGSGPDYGFAIVDVATLSLTAAETRSSTSLPAFDHSTHLGPEFAYSHVITGLHAATSYYVRVATHGTFTSFGPATLSEPSSMAPAAEPPAAPLPPTLLLSSTSGLTLVWLPPDNDGGAPVLGYSLEMASWTGGGIGAAAAPPPMRALPGLSRAATSSVVTQVTTTLSPWRIVYDGAAPNVTAASVAAPYVADGGIYRFRLRARNAAGASMPSVESIFTARAPTVPVTPPAPLRAAAACGVALGGATATAGVYFTRPADNGGAPLTAMQILRDDAGASSGAAPFRVAVVDALEIQRIFMSSAVSSPMLLLSLRGYSFGPLNTTALLVALPVDAALAVRTALETRNAFGAGIGLVDVAVLPSVTGTLALAVTFFTLPGDVELLGVAGGAAVTVTEISSGGGTPLVLAVTVVTGSGAAFSASDVWQLVPLEGCGAGANLPASALVTAADGTSAVTARTSSQLASALAPSFGGAGATVFVSVRDDVPARSSNGTLSAKRTWLIAVGPGAAYPLPVYLPVVTGGGGSATVAVVQSHANVHVAGGLAIGRSYAFSVVAANVYGASPPSPSSSVLAATEPAQPHYAPVVDETTAESVTLHWDWDDGTTNFDFVAQTGAPSPAPAYASVDNAGGSRVTGFRVYAFTDVAVAGDWTPAEDPTLLTITAGSPLRGCVQTISFWNTSLPMRRKSPWRLRYDAMKRSTWSGSLDDAIVLETNVIDLASPSLAADVEKVLAEVCAGGDAPELCEVKAVIAANDADGRLDVTLTFPGWARRVSMLIAIDSRSGDGSEYIAPSTQTSMVNADTSSTFTSTFTLGHRGGVTRHLSYDASASDIEAALEALPATNRVRVVRTSGVSDRDAVTFSITFESTPLTFLWPSTHVLGFDDLVALPHGHARVVILGSRARRRAYFDGNAAVLVYDGVGAPSTRRVVLSGLRPGRSYAFCVSALNAVGEGVLSSPSLIVVTHPGAAAAQTTASGPALASGIAGGVCEQQVLTLLCSGPCRGAQGDMLTVRFGAASANISFPVNASPAILEATLRAAARDGHAFLPVRVSGTPQGGGGYAWSVTFDARDGNVPLGVLDASSVIVGAQFVVRTTVSEYVRGIANTFSIQPRDAAGHVVTDSTPGGLAATGGRELFFTELWRSSRDAPLPASHHGQWVSDGGIARYSRSVLEVQRLVTSGNATMGSFSVAYANGTASRPIAWNASAADVHIALALLQGLGAISVSRTASAPDMPQAATGYSWFITFLGSLGSQPRLSVVADGTFNGAVSVQTADDMSETACAKGVTEVQTLTTWSDVSTVTGSFVLGFGGDETYSIGANASADDVASALSSLAPIAPGHVSVSRRAFANGFTWTVTFATTLGDLPLMNAYAVVRDVQALTTMGGSPTPVGGSFTLSMDSVRWTRQLRFDASAVAVAAALEAVGSGEVAVQRTPTSLQNAAGTFMWTVTFRGINGSAPLLSVDTTRMTGTNASVAVASVQTGVSVTLGPRATVRVEELVGGLPSYEGRYDGNTAGSFDLVVRQLTHGGLMAEYFDNQWLQGLPSLSRIDGPIAFDWDTALVTPFGRDYVSVRWSGKLLVPSQEMLTLIVTANDGARLYFDHNLIIDIWSGIAHDRASTLATRHASRLNSSTADDGSRLASEASATMPVIGGTFHDVVLEYRELVGSASISFEWMSPTLARSSIPAEFLFNAVHISGSPFVLTVEPGAADFPFSTAYGIGLRSAVAGEPTPIVIQACDGEGNNKTAGGDAFAVVLTGPGGVTIAAAPVYIGDGLYQATYTAAIAGAYSLAIRTGVSAGALTSGGNDIFCGAGAIARCSPWLLTVRSGATASYASSLFDGLHTGVDRAGLPQGGLTRGIAGVMSYVTVVTRDTYGNLRAVGGENITVRLLTAGMLPQLLSSQSAYRGDVQDLGNGNYTVSYTVVATGAYTLDVRLVGGGQVFPVGTTASAVVTIVHAELYAASCVATGTGLATATSGMAASIVITSRDAFGNVRTGDGVDGRGGISDAFLVTATHVSTGRVVLAASSRIALLNITAFNGTWTITADAVHGPRYGTSGISPTTESLPYDISPAALRRVLQRLFVNRGAADFNVVLDARASIGPSRIYLVSFLVPGNDADEWGAGGPWDGAPPLSVNASGLVRGAALGNATVSMDASTAASGFYRVSYTLFEAGLWDLAVTSRGHHIQGSPFALVVSPSSLDASSSTAYGSGLVGGYAGDTIAFEVTARDRRQPASQAIVIDSVVVPTTPEIREYSCTAGGSGALVFAWAGATSPPLAIGAGITAAALAASIRLHPWVAALGGLVSVYSGANSQLALICPAVSATLQQFNVTISGIGNLNGATMSVIAAGLANATIANVTELPLTMQSGTIAGRRTVQVFTCASPSALLSLRFRGANISLPLYNASGVPITVSAFVAAVTPIVGSITILAAPRNANGGAPAQVAASAPLCAFPYGMNYSIVYNSLAGDVEPPVTSDPLFTFMVAVPGISPHWGTYTVGFVGAVSNPIRTDASAATVAATLAVMRTIGAVSVAATPLGDDGLGRPARTMYLITFNAPGGTVPVNTGPQPLLTLQLSSIEVARSGQVPPQADVGALDVGTIGNARPDGSDVDALHVVLQDTAHGTVIGAHAVQAIGRCAAISGGYRLRLGGTSESVFVPTGANCSTLQKYLNLIPAVTILGGVIVSSADGTAGVRLCGSGDHWLLVTWYAVGARPRFVIGRGQDTFAPLDATGAVVDPPDTWVSTVGGLTAAYIPSSRGLFAVQFMTPLAGSYALQITFGGSGQFIPLAALPSGAAISLDWGLRLAIVPQPQRIFGAQCSHNASAVATAGSTSTFVIQARDSFGNSLIADISGLDAFVVRLTHRGAGANATPPTSGTVVSEASPNAGGRYISTVTPIVSGRHELTVSLLRPGGLLATYFRLPGMINPVFACASGVDDTWHSGTNSSCVLCAEASVGAFGNATGYHWVTPSTVSYRKHEDTIATRVDGRLDFDWAASPPLPALLPPLAGSSFSVRWEGYLRMPTSDVNAGLVSLHLEADPGARVWIGNMSHVVAGANADILVIDTQSRKRGQLSAASESSVRLHSAVPGQLIPIRIDYSAVTQTLERPIASRSGILRLGWSSAALGRHVEIIPSDALYYEVNIRNSPIEVDVVAGPLAAVATVADGVGLSVATAGSVAKFTIIAADAAGNVRSAVGSDTFVITVKGTIGTPTAGLVLASLDESVSVTAMDWLDSGIFANVSRDDAFLSTSADARGIFTAGDVVSLDGVALVTMAATSDQHSLSINSPWRSSDLRQMRMFRAGPRTGTHLVSFVPSVAGAYAIDVMLGPIGSVQVCSIRAATPISGLFFLKLRGLLTPAMMWNATSAQFATALAALVPIVLSAVPNVRQALAPSSSGASWVVSFSADDGDVPLLATDGSELSGAGARVDVSSVTQGVDAKPIWGSPFALYVAPGGVHAAASTGFGPALASTGVVAGVTTGFTIQLRDAEGNDSVDDAACVLATVIPPTSGMSLSSSTFAAEVAPIGNGRYAINFTPVVAGPHSISVALLVTPNIQTLALDFPSGSVNSGRSGVFALMYNGSSTSLLTWDISADELVAAIKALPMAPSNISVTRVATIGAGAADGFSWTLTLSGVPGVYFEFLPRQQLILPIGAAVTSSQLTPATLALVHTNNNRLRQTVQLLTLSVGFGGISGTFQLSLIGQATMHLPWNISAAALASALGSLPCVGGNAGVLVAGGVSGSGGVWTISFVPQVSVNGNWVLTSLAALVGPIPLLVAYGDGLTGGAAVSVEPISSGIAPFVVLVNPGLTVPGACTAGDTQPGPLALSAAIVGIQSSFTVTPRDGFGNARVSDPMSEVQVLVIIASLTAGNSSASTAMSLLSELSTALAGSAIGVGMVGGTMQSISLVDAAGIVISASLLAAAISRVPAAGRVAVTRSAVTRDNGFISIEFIITFDASLGDVPALTLDVTSLGAGIAARLISCTANSVQAVATHVAPGGAVIGGSFQLRMISGSGRDGLRDPGDDDFVRIAFDATADDVAAAIGTLPNIHNVTVTRRGPTASNEFSWLVSLFRQAGESHQPLILLQACAQDLRGDNSSVSVSPYCSVSPHGTVSVAGIVGMTIIARAVHVGGDVAVAPVADVVADVSWVPSSSG